MAVPAAVPLVAASGWAEGLVSRVRGAFPWLGSTGRDDASAAPRLPRVVVLSSLFINILGLAMPMVMLQVYDRILPNKATETLALLILGMFGVVAVDTIMKLARAYMVGFVAHRHHFQLATEALTRLIHAPERLLESDAPSVHFDRVNALDTLRDFYGGQARLLLLDLPFILIFLALLAFLGHWLALVPVVIFLGLGSVAINRSRALRVVAQTRAEHDDRRYDFIIESLSAIETIKAMAMEPQIQRRFERLQQVGARASYDTILIGNEAQNGGNFLSNVTMVAVVTIGAMMVIGGSLSMGTLAACTLLSGRMIQPLLRGLDLWTQMQSLAVARTQVQTLFKLPAAPARPRPLANCRGAISIRNLCFAYSATVPPIIRDLNLEVEAGEIVGLKGGDGSGKSTLLRLLRGDLPPLSGKIEVDGHDVSGPQRAALSGVIATVSQRPVLFRGTILENITMFRTGEAIDDAREAARLIGLEEVIHRMPEGYDMIVGDGVSNALPDGVGQRIAIARALAGRPKILLFDEGNSTLDAVSDDLLRQGLINLKGRMTIILASQRPSLLRISDRVLTLRDGALHSVQATPARPAMRLDEIMRLEAS